MNFRSTCSPLLFGDGWHLSPEISGWVVAVLSQGKIGSALMNYLNPTVLCRTGLPKSLSSDFCQEFWFYCCFCQDFWKFSHISASFQSLNAWLYPFLRPSVLPSFREIFVFQLWSMMTYSAIKKQTNSQTWVKPVLKQKTSLLFESLESKCHGNTATTQKNLIWLVL